MWLQRSITNLKYPQLLYVRSFKAPCFEPVYPDVIIPGFNPVVLFAKFVRKAQLPECSCAIVKSNGHSVAYIFIQYFAAHNALSLPRHRIRPASPAVPAYADPSRIPFCRSVRPCRVRHTKSCAGSCPRYNPGAGSRSCCTIQRRRSVHTGA